jgi:potassium efflux system protein
LDDKVIILGDTGRIFQLDRLAKEARELDLIEKELAVWENSITDLSNLSKKQNSQIDSMSLIWKLTRDSLNVALRSGESIDNSQQAVDIKAEISDFILQLDTTKASLNKYNSNLESVQAKITLADVKLGRAANLAENRRTADVKSLWRPSYPLIWQVKMDTVSQDKVNFFTNILGRDRDIISIYFNNNDDLKYHIVLYFGLVLTIILYMRSKARKLYETYTEELQEAKTLLEHPAMATLTIGWFISVVIGLFPNELDDIISLIMLFPLLYLLTKLYPEWKWRQVIVFTSAYLLLLLFTRLNYDYLIQRLVLLFIDIIALILFVYMRRQKEFIKTHNSNWYGTLPFVIEVFIILSLVAIGADIIGSIQLAQIITSAVLGTVIAIVALQAVVAIARSLAYLLIMGPLIKNSEALHNDRKLILSKLDSFFRFAGFASWVYIFLKLININQLVFGAIDSFINTPLTVGELSISLGNVLAFFITIQISTWLYKFITYILENEVFTRVQLKPGVPNTIVLMTRFTIAILGVLMAFSAAGIQMDKIAIAIGGLGVGIGFGLQGIVNNFVSGVVIALERPFKIGDTIDIPDASGIVKDIGLRSTIVRTWSGSDVIVPNGALISGQVTNWTYYDRHRRISTELLIPLDTDMESFMQFVLTEAAKIPEVLIKPGPYTNFNGAKNGAMSVNIYCWINNVDNVFSSGTAIRKGIFKAMKDGGYDIQIPIQELLIEQESQTPKPAAPAKRPKPKTPRSKSQTKPKPPKAKE